VSDSAAALRGVLVATAVVASCWLLIAVVRRARRGGKGVQALGAMLMMFGWGSMRDPRNDTVAEAQEGRIRKGTHSGDPPDPDAR
jgi:hypothetical protein